MMIDQLMMIDAQVIFLWKNKNLNTAESLKNSSTYYLKNCIPEAQKLVSHKENATEIEIISLKLWKLEHLSSILSICIKLFK